MKTYKQTDLKPHTFINSVPAGRKWSASSPSYLTRSTQWKKAYAGSKAGLCVVPKRTIPNLPVNQTTIKPAANHLN
jgi:hypothetical protein